MTINIVLCYHGLAFVGCCANKASRDISASSASEISLFRPYPTASGLEAVAIWDTKAIGIFKEKTQGFDQERPGEVIVTGLLLGVLDPVTYASKMIRILGQVAAYRLNVIII